jgi:hypothetical protein
MFQPPSFRQSLPRHGLPRERRNPVPWTVTCWLRKCLIEHLGWLKVCHPWTLDSGIHTGMTAFAQWLNHLTNQVFL